MIRLCITGESAYLRRYALLVRAIGKLGYDVSILDDERTSASAWIRHVNTVSAFGIGATLAAWASRERVDREKIKSAFYRSADAFVAKSRSFQERIAREADKPDLILHLFGFSSPFATQPSLPYVHYLDDTAALRARSGEAPTKSSSPKETERFALLERTSYERAAHIFAASPFVATSLENDYGIPRSKIEIVGTGPTIDIADGIPKLYGSRRLVFNASEFSRRGGELVMAAFEVIRRADPSITLVTVGAPLPSAYAGRDGVDDRGLVTPDVMRELYTTSDVLLAPTLSGPLPHVAMEALAHGMPVIVRDRDGVSDLLTDGLDSVIVSDADARPDRLAEMIREIVDDDARLRALSEGARATVAARLNWSVAAEKMSPFFETIHRTVDA
jgi:glycosyltransferase involved in cell wall biosynthesis